MKKRIANKSGTGILASMGPVVQKHVIRGWKCNLRFFWPLTAFTFPFACFWQLQLYATEAFGIHKGWSVLFLMLVSAAVSPFHTGLLNACRLALQGRNPRNAPLYILDQRTISVMWVDLVILFLQKSPNVLDPLSALKDVNTGWVFIYLTETLLLLAVTLIFAWIIAIRLFPAAVMASGGTKGSLYKSWLVTEGKGWEILKLCFATFSPFLILLVPMLLIGIENFKHPGKFDETVLTIFGLITGILSGFGYLVIVSYSLVLEQKAKKIKFRGPFESRA